MIACALARAAALCPLSHGLWLRVLGCSLALGAAEDRWQRRWLTRRSRYRYLYLRHAIGDIRDPDGVIVVPPAAPARAKRAQPTTTP